MRDVVGIFLMLGIALLFLSCHGGSPLLYGQGKADAERKPRRVATIEPRPVANHLDHMEAAESTSNYFPTADYTQNSVWPESTTEKGHTYVSESRTTPRPARLRASDRTTYEAEIAMRALDESLQAVVEFLPTPWLRVTACLAVRMGVKYSKPFVAWCIETFDLRPSESEWIRLVAGE